RPESVQSAGAADGSRLLHRPQLRREGGGGTAACAGRRADRRRRSRPLPRPGWLQASGRRAKRGRPTARTSAMSTPHLVSGFSRTFSVVLCALLLLAAAAPATAQAANPW